MQRIMEQLALDVHRFGNRGSGRYLGSCEFRDHPGEYPVTADYNLGGGALRVFVDGFAEMLVEGKGPADLAGMLKRALDSAQDR